jgi:hypothetical protein
MTKTSEISGTKAIAGALEKGTVTNLILCSCRIHADGAACFAKSLRGMGRRCIATSTETSWEFSERSLNREVASILQQPCGVR